MNFLVFKVILGSFGALAGYSYVFDDTHFSHTQCVMYILHGNFLQWVGLGMLRARMCVCKILSSCHMM